MVSFLASYSFSAKLIITFMHNAKHNIIIQHFNGGTLLSLVS